MIMYELARHIMCGMEGKELNIYSPELFFWYVIMFNVSRNELILISGCVGLKLRETV